jgi:argininosuccinate lyase
VTLWGGRFEDAPAAALWEFTVDPSDRRLLASDVLGSRAHVVMLERVGLLDAAEAEALLGGLDVIEQEALSGAFTFLASDEDVHSALERRLFELAGDVAGKLHTGRSRNDQVSLDVRIYLREAGRERSAQLRAMIEVLAAKAESVADVVVPSYTHLQQAQAVSLGHHLLAYGWMLARDIERFSSCLDRVAVSPLGAGASAGSSLPLDPGIVASELGFPAVFDNSLDAVGSRDFVSEYVFCCAQAMVHLSRLAEELVLWATSEFGWVTYRDRDTTGSSALPHKKNPDAAELARGKAAAVAGDVATLLALQKGLPLAYNRDLQEDKRALFHADDTLAGALSALSEMVDGARFAPPAPSPWVSALDLAELLVRRGVPFREAHGAVGRLVSGLLASGRDLSTVTADDLAGADPRFEPGDVAAADPEHSLRSRATPGAGSPDSVRSQAAALRDLLSGGD